MSWTVWGSFPCRYKKFVIIENARTGPGAHPTFSTVFAGVSFP